MTGRLAKLVRCSAMSHSRLPSAQMMPWTHPTTSGLQSGSPITWFRGDCFAYRLLATAGEPEMPVFLFYHGDQWSAMVPSGAPAAELGAAFSGIRSYVSRTLRNLPEVPTRVNARPVAANRFLSWLLTWWNMPAGTSKNWGGGFAWSCGRDRHRP